MTELKKRKCSVCRNLGHDKRTCALVVGETKAKRAKRQAIKKNTPRNPAVFVQVSKDIQQSPHVVDLKNTEREETFSKTNVFLETPYTPTKRVTVDFGALVRQAQKEKIGDRRLEIGQGAGSREQGSGIRERRAIGGRRESTLNNQQSAISDQQSKISYHVSRITYQLCDGFRTFTEQTLGSLQHIREAVTMKRFAYAALALLMIAVLPFPVVGYYAKVIDDSRRVVEESTNAFLSLQSSTLAALQSNIPQAQYDLNAALQSFESAGSIVEREHRALVYVMSLLPVVGTQVLSRQRLLSAGHHLALGNAYLVQGVSAVEASDDPLTTRLALLRAHLKAAIPQYAEALAEFGGVEKSAVPSEYQQSLDEFKILFAAFLDDMNDLADLADALELLLGGEELKRYLVVFQNQNELRPTGGFMGSFATLDVQKGRVLALDVPAGGTYDLQGQLDVFVKPPLPLQAVNKRWEFQDANWFPDFPLSAQKIEWFYQHGRGATTDGVIAVNASVLERLLRVIGPIADPERGLVLAADNVLEALQEEVETGEEKRENKPKAVLGDLLSLIFERLEQAQTVDMIRLLSELHDALEEKEIQVYVNDVSLYQSLSGFGWTGEIESTEPRQDYLLVVNANIHGQKSDAKILQTIEHQAVVGEDGSVIDTVFIKRRHTGIRGELFSGVPNVSYVRVYVPEGSELIDAGGFTFPPEDVFKTPESWYEDDADLAGLEVEQGVHAGSGTRITNEFDKTAFGNWMIVSPGDTAEAYVTYKLPFNVFDGEESRTQGGWRTLIAGDPGEASRYSVFVQKQSGTESAFRSAVIYPSGWRPVWKSRDDVDLASNGAAIETVLKTDEVFGVVMERRSNQ